MRARCPAAEFLHDRLRLISPFGKSIDLNACRRRQLAPHNDPARFQFGQTLGKHVGADSGQVGAQVTEASWTEHKLAHHEQSPTIAEQFQAVRHAAGVVIGAFFGAFWCFGYIF